MTVASRARHIAREEGLGPMAKRGFRWLIRQVNLARARRRVKGHQALPIDAALDFAFGMRVGDVAITPMQVRSEIRALLEIVERSPPLVIMEIGTANGGTLFLLANVARSDALLVSIDLPGGPYGGGYAPERARLYEAFAREQQQVALIRSNSRDPDTVATVARELDAASVDLLFIDGDHSYEGVASDYRLYAPFVRPGGLIVFHDIAEHDEPGIGVKRFWGETKGEFADALEIIDNRKQRWAGIGVGTKAAPPP